MVGWRQEVGMLTWTPELALGVDELDAQHQELFRRADAFLEGLGTAASAEVEQLLGFLAEHAGAHFGAEEAWMEGAGYPDLEAHRAEHRRFLADLAARADGGGGTPLEVAAWLVRWLHDHLVQADGAAARCIRRQGRDGQARS
jgi:hemerythrin